MKCKVLILLASLLIAGCAAQSTISTTALTPYGGDADDSGLPFKSKKPWLWQKNKMPDKASMGTFEFWQEWRRKDCIKILKESPWVKSGGIGSIQGVGAAILIGSQVEAKGLEFVATILSEPVLRAMVRIKQIDQRTPAEEAERELRQWMQMLDPDKIQITISIADQHMTMAVDPFKRRQIEHGDIDYGLQNFGKKCFIQKKKDAADDFLRAASAPKPEPLAGCDYYLEFQNAGFVSKKDKEFYFVGNFYKKLKLKYKIKDMVVGDELFL